MRTDAAYRCKLIEEDELVTDEAWMNGGMERSRPSLESLPPRGLVFLALHSVSPGTTGSWQASWTDAAADAARALERNYAAVIQREAKSYDEIEGFLR